MALTWVELNQEPRTARDARAGGCGDLDLARDQHDPGALVNLMVLQALALREMKHNRPRVLR